jgi:hypothetical protein
VRKSEDIRKPEELTARLKVHKTGSMSIGDLASGIPFHASAWGAILDSVWQGSWSGLLTGLTIAADGKIRN